MSLTLPEPRVLANVDDYLGAAAQRFFGSGYRKTSPILRKLVIQHHIDGSTTLESRGSLGVGDLWSVKGSAAQRPHLGTTDAIVLALEAAEALLASKYSPAFLPGVYVRSLSISAGGTPIEETLADFPVTAHAEENSASGEMTVNVQMDSMRAVVCVHHPLSVAGSADLQTESADSLVGDSKRRVYGSLYKTRTSSIRNITLRPNESGAHSTVDVTSEDDSVEHIGLEAAYQPGLSLLESFVTTLQVGQILLYELDSITRAESNTLWMRKTTITTSGPPPSIQSPLTLDVRLKRSRVLNLNGEDWRCADIVGRIGDRIEVVCDVAHKLPH